MKLTLYVIIILVGQCVLFAQEEKKHPIDKFLESCIDKDYSTTGMWECTEEGTRRWDSLLNFNYKRLLKVLNKEEADFLKAAQKKWIEYRDEHFKFTRKFYGRRQGTMWINISSGERYDFIKNRALELESFYTTYLNSDVFE